jgi:hypothetical protein
MAFGKTLSWGLILFLGCVSARAKSGLGQVSNFELKDYLGKSHELYLQNRAKAIVLIFASTGCPIVQKSVPKIKGLRDQFGPRGVVFWLINSSSIDDAAAIGEEARDFKIDVPILMDRELFVARAVKATRTAEVVCIQPNAWKVFYRGAIDDQLGYGTEKGKVTHAYLENALNNFLAGKKVSPSQTDFKGCRIQFDAVDKK